MAKNEIEKASAKKVELEGHAAKPGSAAVPDGSMSIVGHLSEIKSRISRIILVLVAGIVACSIFVEKIVIAFINRGSGFNFVYISPSELVTCYVKIVMIAALVIASPVIIFQVWGFVRPALDQNEKHFGFLALLGGLGLFIVGVCFAYFVALPFTINFFVNFDTTGLINAQISFENYINFLLSLLLTFGLVFEMPVLTLMLSELGIIKPEHLIKMRKLAILIIFIVGAIITPPDVVSQLAVAIPMLVLYEISILVCSAIVKRKQAKKQAAA